MGFALVIAGSINVSTNDSVPVSHESAAVTTSSIYSALTNNVGQDPNVSQQGMDVVMSPTITISTTPIISSVDDSFVCDCLFVFYSIFICNVLRIFKCFFFVLLFFIV